MIKLRIWVRTEAGHTISYTFLVSSSILTESSDFMVYDKSVSCCYIGFLPQ